MTAPLKPCPFCGGQAECGGGNSTYGRLWWSVWCNKCQVELRDREVWDKTRPGMLDPAFPPGECLTRWNTRADAPELLALVEAVRELVSEAWGYGHLFDTPFHAHVHDVLHGKLEAYEALK